VQEYAWRAAELIERDPFLERVRAIGRRLSLAQLFLKLTVPGVADIYRGDELEDLSLVDPDNRRPVDWDARRRTLDALKDGAPVDDANAKLYVIWKTLNLLRGREVSYEPVDMGPGIVAFRRGGALVAAGVDPNAEVRVEGDVLGVPGLGLAV